MIRKKGPPAETPSPAPESAGELDPLAEAAATPQGQLGWLSHKYGNLQQALFHLSHRDDGWLRVVPDEDNQTLWLKWKFTRGRWEKHYVMAKVQLERIEEGLQLLVHKLHMIDLGDKKPSVDRLYGEE